MRYSYGFECELSYKTAGVGGAGSWVVAEKIKDVTVTVETSEADVTTRANNGWEAVVAALKKGSIEFEMIADMDDAAFAAFRTAFFAGTAIGIKAIDKYGEGLIADMMVLKFSRNEPLGGVATYSVSIKPTLSDTAPDWQEGT